ncbi:hypothetical protein L7F22_019084 [Adiantum nelumboides]|nr:hypothetical protein [Adiantum nelumboides]
MTNKAHILIVGGGVIGISTAIALLNHPIEPYDVTIIAPDLPSLDSTTYRPNPVQGEAALASYASAWAGAHHVSDAKTPKQIKRDRETFKVLTKLEEAWKKQKWSKDISKRPLVYVYQTEYWSHKAELLESCVDWYPDYKQLPKESLPESIDFGATFKTLDLDIPKYLPMLYAYFLQLGGRSIKHKATSISEAISLSYSSAASVTQLIDGKARTSKSKSTSIKPSLVIASPGLGAKELLGDNDVLPIRGQTVLLHAPWCTTSAVHGVKTAKESETNWCGVSKVIAAQGGYRDTYLIPRGDGTIICGGTRLEDDYDVEPRIETSHDILRRVLELMPQLQIPKEINNNKETQQNNPHAGEYNVEIAAVNVGLRPGRKGGIRLENGPKVDEIPMVFCYGFGGIGYQSSWGAAFEARSLVDKALNRSLAPDQSTFADLDSGNLSLPDPSTLLIKEHINGISPAVNGH